VTRHHTFQTPALTASGQQSTVTLVTKSTTSSLLSTCRTINTEASHILAPQLEKLRAEPLRLIVDSAAMDFAHARDGILPRFKALAAQVISKPPPPPPSKYPPPSAGTPLHLFIDKCVSHLTYAASPSVPTNQARGIVISLTGTPCCQIQFVSSHSLQSFMRAIFGDIGRVVSSYAVIYKPGGGITMNAA
jgi:hypothetical protein